MIALIPARCGSKRVVHKNIRPLAGVPLMCWTIAVAKESHLFNHVIVSTDSPDYCDLAYAWGAEPLLRPEEMATDTATDFPWIKHALGRFPGSDAFALLRPTSPFRTVDELERAFEWFYNSKADSIRAVQKVSEHPCKMWVVHDKRMSQLIPTWDINVMQTQSMPVVYWANSSLEMAWAGVIRGGTYSGYDIAPFYTNWLEAFDIHDEADFRHAEAIVKAGIAKKPSRPLPDSDVLEWDE